MFNRSIKLWWRRRLRSSKRQVEDFGVQTEEHMEKLFFRRLSRLYGVRRFIAAWIVLVSALALGVILQTRGLSGYYQELKPAPGGTYVEGIIGSFTTANPLYATGGVDGTVSRLVFASLMKYDSKNQLVGDLASVITGDEQGLRYEVRLRDNLHWHDGQRLTADDVIFTYQTIQNPDAKSPFFTSWQGIKLEKVDAYTVAFTLPNTFSAFPHALTNGIVPKHILENIPVSQLRSVPFNTSPVGSGPFKLDTIEVTGMTPETRQEQVGMSAYEDYHGGAPKIQRFVVRSFRDESQVIASFRDQELNAIVGLNSFPDTLSSRSNVEEHNIPLTGEVAVFFKASEGVLSDPKVRQALVKAADTSEVIVGLSHSVIPARGPLLAIHVGYDKNLEQLPYNPDEAKVLLDGAGWAVGEDGLRRKDGQPLAFNLSAQSNSEYAYVTQALQQQWREIGVDAQVTLHDNADLQGLVARHEYDAILYGISLGTDPDVFAYWHSSQADPRAATRLNLSEYKSSAADRALEAGRTRSDNALRAAKYRPFLEAWRNDAPALVLYQPRFLYITAGKVHGFNPDVLNNANERFGTVQDWMIREVKTTK